MTDASEKLSQARALIADVKGLFFTGGYVEGARLLNDMVNLLADEITSLDKTIGAGQP